MADSNLITAFVAAGGGTVLGSIITGMIQTLGNRGKNRADAADITVSVAGRMVDRLETENKAMRHSIVLITKTIDEIILDISDAAAREKLRKLNNAAREALSAGDYDEPKR